MSFTEQIQEEPFPSDEEFDEEGDSDSSTDVDARVAEDDVFDLEFFKCYSALKKKDDKIYNKDVEFFTEEPESAHDEARDGKDGASPPKRLLPWTKSEPVMTLLDHQLSLQNDIDQDSEFKPKIDLNQEVSKSFYQKELDEIKQSIEKVNEDMDSDDEEFLVVKGSKSQPRNKIDTMLDKIEDDDDENISQLRQMWSNPDGLTEDEKYLRDFILNKRYIPKEAESDDDVKEDFFSKNLDDVSDAEEQKTEPIKKVKAGQRSEEKDCDKIVRIPRNSTKTIRDIVEKREKKEKRMKKVLNEKKKKKLIKNEEFEDIVGDLHTKFHYRETEPNDYGLSAEELLMATDAELDEWVSLRDTVRFKSSNEEKMLKEKYESRRNDIELKKKIFKSIYGDSDNDTPTEESKKPKNKKKKDAQQEMQQGGGAPEEPEAKNSKRKKKHKRGLNHKKIKTGVAPDRLLAYGLSKTKLKRSKLL